MKAPFAVAIACLGSLVAMPAYAVEDLPLPHHKPLYSQQGLSTRERSPRMLAVVDYTAPAGSIRPVHAARCRNALCPGYVVLGTSY